MKLTAVLLLAALLQVSAKTTAQTISLTMKNQPLQTVFQEIKKQSGYSFFYKVSLENKFKNVTVQLHDASLQQTLEQVLKGQDLNYEVVNKTVVIKEKDASAKEYNALIPPIDVRGRVVNEKGEPINVTITVKGTKRAVVTNEKGDFEITGIEENGVLVISGVNIETLELKVNGRTDIGTINAKAKVTALSDVQVVSTGYQQLPKERVTGSFDRVDNTLLNEQVGPNILQRLEGVSNVLFDKSPSNLRPNFTIRGISSINGPKDPLIILNNFPYEGDINNINPNDIEDITILKDAAATSIWGTRAGNGVIVITTKKAKFNQPFKIELNSNITVGQKPNLFYLQQMSTSDYIDVEQFLFGKGYYTNQENSVSRPVLSPVIEILIKQRNGQMTSTDAKTAIDALRNIDFRDEANKYLNSKSLNKQLSGNISGGNDRMNYILSGGYDKNIANDDSKYNRINFRSENMIRPVKNLDLTVGINFIESNRESGKPSYASFNSTDPYAQFVAEDGSSLPQYRYRKGYIDTAGTGRLLDWKYYPYEDYLHDHYSTRTSDLITNLGVQYRLPKGFTAVLRYSYENQKSQRTNLKDEESYYVRDLVNRFSQINYSTGAVKYVVPKGGILDKSLSTLSSHNLRAQLNYNLSTNNSNLAMIAGAEARSIKTLGFGSRIYGYNKDILTFSTVDNANSYPTFITKVNSFIPSGTSESEILNRFVSVYANASYTYKDKYILSGSARRDGSNLFGVKANDKWNPLWSAGAAWNLSKEKFYHLSFIPYLKLRTTFGYSGNVDQSKAAVTTLRYLGSSSFTNQPLAVVSQYKNESLRWEKVRMINIALDFGTRKDFINGSVEYYSKVATDLFSETPIDYTIAGIRTLTKNVASMKGSGIEAGINIKNLNRELKWKTSILFNYNTTHITEYFISNFSGSTHNSDGRQITPLKGYPVYSILSFPYAGLDNAGNPQGYLNGQLSTDYTAILSNMQASDLVYSGPATPPFFGSLNNSVSWKGISLSVGITYKLGYYFRRRALHYGQLFLGIERNADFAKRWQKPGDELITDVPSMVYPAVSNRDALYGNSEALVEKGDHFRLQYINLNYDLGSAVKNRQLFKKFELFLNASNLGIIWKATSTSLDPEYGTDIIPPARTISVGVRANF